MIDSVISAFANLASGDVSRKQLLTIVVMSILAFATIAIYERYTSTFRLARLERATQLLKELVELKPLVQGDAELVSTHSSIMSSLNEIMGTVQKQVARHSLLAKVASGFVMWFLFGLSMGKKNATDRNARHGVWGFGVFVALVCAFLPERSWPWYHLIVYPIGSIVMIIVIVLVASVTPGKSNSKEVKA